MSKLSSFILKSSDFFAGFCLASALFAFVGIFKNTVKIQGETPIAQVGDCFTEYLYIDDEFKTPEVFMKIKIIKVGKKSYLAKSTNPLGEREISLDFSYLDSKHIKKTECD